MAYWEDVWRFPGSNEYEFKWMGNYGAKGEKRAAKRKATPEQIKKQNRYIREKNMRRLIKKNFKKNDLWCTLKYPKGTRKAVEEVKKDLQRFIRTLRRRFQKIGEELKFIYRMEIGARGGIHIHFLCNRTRGEPATDVLIQELWQQGRVNFQNLYDFGDYEDLAAYIVKDSSEEQEKQLSLFDEEERKKLTTYSSSRNLIRPEPERKVYRRRTLRRIIENGIKPKPGFYIDKRSVVYGVNKFTGMSYLHYTEIRIDPGGDG